MKVLITGGTGFLGGHLVEACVARGDEVTAVVRKASDLSHLKTLGSALTFAFGDLTDPETAVRVTQNQDVVIHSAARVYEYGSYRQFFDVNVKGTEYLLKAARRNGVKRFVYVSSPSVVAETRPQIFIDESYPIPKTFLNYYSRTKAMAEEKVLRANDEGLTTCAIRPRGVWGIRDYKGFLFLFVERLRAGKIRDISGGKEVLISLCHVDNAVQACLRACDSRAVGGKAYFITDETPVNLWGFINRLAREFDAPEVSKTLSPKLVATIACVVELIWKIPSLKNNRQPPITRYTASFLTNTSTFNIDRAKEDFGYAPGVDLEHGLAQLKKWVNENGGIDAFV